MTRLTREQAAVISAYTGFLAGPFGDMHEYAERKLGRPIFTHEFAGPVSAQLRELARADFLALVAKDL